MITSIKMAAGVPMHLQTQQLALKLKVPFTLAHGSSTERQNILVRLSNGPHTGLGEAAVVPYTGDTPQRIVDYLEDPRVSGALASEMSSPEEILDRLPDGPAAARAALDMALHDLWGQRLGQPLYAIWGLDSRRCPHSSFTVAMSEDNDAYLQHLRAAAGFPIVKLKLGSGDTRRDLDLVRMARKELTARLCVDVNGGWSVDEAAEIIPQLLPYDLLFIEQPVGDRAAWSALCSALPHNAPPLIADESVQGADDISKLVGLADGINVKLAKCGGLRPAQQMIERARARNMSVLVGCMIESSVAVTAAAHLAPLCDFADLDGNLLVVNDPFRGVRLERGRLHLPRGPGLGLER
jgi:L-alanine-DL-glutamate epimerase-like enolase superfamily enzyme